MAFVLDLSSGDLDLIYRASLPFIRLVADGLPLRPDRVRLAFVTAVDSPTVQFYLNTYRYVRLYTVGQKFLFHSRTHTAYLYRCV